MRNCELVVMNLVLDLTMREAAKGFLLREIRHALRQDDR